MLDAARSAPLHLFLDEVKKRGSIGLALCPFHQDTKPSLTIFDEVRYHCFVCQSHGDAIDLLMRRDGLRWKQAVKTVLTTMGYVIAV
jgi:DNA primase